MDALASAVGSMLGQYGAQGTAIILVVAVLIYLQREGKSMRDELRADLKEAREELRFRRQQEAKSAEDDEPTTEGQA